MSAAETLRANVAQAQAVAIVIDRANRADAVASIEKLGGGWAHGIAVWPDELEFLVMVAADIERCRKRAPVLFMVRDISALASTMRMAVSLLDDVRCLWLRLVEPAALEIVSAEILRDSVPGGRA